MRIIAGEFGGRMIKAPSKSSIHPMGEKIRGAIFNKISNRIGDAQVLDAFAGSGAIGLEALSRGAKKVTFVESDRQAILVLKQNFEQLKLDSSRFDLMPTTVSNWLAKTPVGDYDFIFADPPYFNPQPKLVIQLSLLLKPTGMMIVSWPKRLASLKLVNFDLVDERIYSEAKICFYQAKLEKESSD